MARRSKSPIVAAGLLIIALLVGMFVWQPVREDVATYVSELDAKQASLDALEAEIASLVSVEADLPVAESERERILAAVPLGVNQDELVENLSDIAEEVGISLNSMTFSLQNAESTGAGVLSVSANFSGSYTDLVTLLEALEENERVFNVTSIGVQLGEVTEAGYSMSFAVSLEAYYQD